MESSGPDPHARRTPAGFAVPSSGWATPQHHGADADIRLDAHETLCAERWTRVADALARIDRQIGVLNERWWWLLASLAGAAASIAIGLILDRLP